MKLIVWLWNPWDKYEHTKHNVWFIMLDKLVDKYWFTQFLSNKKFNAFVSDWKFKKWQVLSVKPQTFMNLSWDAVSKIMNFYKINPYDVLVIHDEIDLDFWTIQLKYSGWTAWHNWLKDIVNKIWTKDFWRIRIWVWRPETKEEVVDYVLSRFSKEQLEELDKNSKQIYDKFEEFLKNTG